jgi:NADH-quinone oxidoreductase subunit J
MVIFSNNQVHSVFFLIACFLSGSAILLLLGVEFIAMLFLIVYIGAIAILFLFVVMMLNNYQNIGLSISKYFDIIVFSVLFSIIFLLEVYIFYNPYFSYTLEDNSTLLDYYNSSYDYEYADNLTNVKIIGNILFIDYYNSFIYASLILLVSMIGAIVLTINHRKYVERQSVLHQNFVNFETTIKKLSLPYKKVN